MSPRDELAKLIHDVSCGCKNWEESKGMCYANTIMPWLEQKLAKREAETVGRCAELAKLSPFTSVDKLVAKIRVLSPDPNFLEREKVMARLDEAREARREFDEHFYGKPIPEVDGPVGTSNDPEGLKECLDVRISELERQLAALPKPEAQ